jgi:hypothetical protein
MTLLTKTRKINTFRKYNSTKKVLKTFSNIKNFKKFYKNISKIEKDTLQFYKLNGYIDINKYLYNNNKLNELFINEWKFSNTIEKLYSNNTKNLFNFKNINFEKLPKYIELYVNDKIIKNINILDKLFINKDIPKLNGKEVLFRGISENTYTTPKSKIGDTLIFNSFTSSSTNIDVSKDFMGNKINKNKVICCLYVLNGLKDIPYIYIPWFQIQKKQMKAKISSSIADEFEYLLPRNLKFKIKKIETILDDTISYITSTTFEQLNKIIKKTKNKNNNNNIFKKINNKIKIYHLDFVEHLPVETVEPYVYKSSLKLHYQKSDKNNN